MSDTQSTNQTPPMPQDLASLMQSASDPASFPPDSNQDPTPAPQAPASPPAEKSPLDALEEILRDAKAKGGGGADDKQKAEEEEAQKIKEEEEQKKAEMARQEEEQRLEDQKNLAEQIMKLKSVTDTPEEQARLQQFSQKKDNEDEKQKSADYNAIHQLGHTKI